MTTQGKVVTDEFFRLVELSEKNGTYRIENIYSRISNYKMIDLSIVKYIVKILVIDSDRFSIIDNDILIHEDKIDCIP